MEKKIKIVYQDQDLLVIDKPTGWVSTRENCKLQITNYKLRYVEDWVEENFANDLPRRGVVHRLDKGTSGLLLVALNKQSLENLKKQFKDKTVKKVYWALVAGEVPSSGIMRVPIGRLSGQGKFGVVVGGRYAETSFELIKKYSGANGTFSLLSLSPKTGRTHQIRVHLKYLGWPIVGDSKYGGLRSQNLERPFLQAMEISFEHPTSGRPLIIKSELAEELTDFLKKI